MNFRPFNFKTRNGTQPTAASGTPPANSKTNVSEEPSLPQISTHFRSLDAKKLVQALDRLRQQIESQFPTHDILLVCRELAAVAHHTQSRAMMIDRHRTSWMERLKVSIFILATALLIFVLVLRPDFISWVKSLVYDKTIGSNIQLASSIISIATILTAWVIYLGSMNTRRVRKIILRDLHQLRSFTHVIDMHQLTKDPALSREGSQLTVDGRSSMSASRMARYFDYCSEMLSLTAKLAAIYAQYFPDPVVVSAVNDIETLTTNLSRKIWQKISILESHRSYSAEMLKTSAL